MIEILSDKSADSINILHISDIHFESSKDAYSYCSSLVLDIKIELNIDRLDYVIFSGDIAHHSEPSEYAAACKFMDSLVSKLGIGRDRIIIAPGNHDLSWILTKEAYRSSDKDEALKNKFRYFSDGFYEKYSGKPYPYDYKNQGVLHLYREHKLLFLTLNSCWQIDHKPENLKKSGVHPDSIAYATSELVNSDFHDWLKVAVFHHPVSGLEMMDDAFMETLSILGFNICMHGHIHTAEESFYKYDYKRGVHIIGAGTFGAPSSQQKPGVPLQYNVLRYDPKSAGMRVETRKKVERYGAWSACPIYGDRNDPKSFFSFSLDSLKKNNAEHIRPKTLHNINRHTAPCLLVSDFDGTLLNKDKYISSKTLQAIRDFNVSDSCNYFVIATGRAFRYVEKYYNLLNLNTPIIIYGGAAVYDPVKDDYLYSETINREGCEIIIDKLFKRFQQDGIYVELTWEKYDKLCVYDNYPWVESVKRREKRIYEANKLLNFQDVHRICISVRISEYDKIADYIQEVLKPFTYYMWKFGDLFVIDIHKKDISKFNAFIGMCLADSRFKFALDNCGDVLQDTNVYFILEGDNDRCFLNRDLKIFALNNSLKEIRDQANYVAGPDTADPISKIIYEKIDKKIINSGTQQNYYIITVKTYHIKSFSSYQEYEINNEISNALLYLFNNDYALLDHITIHNEDGVTIVFSQSLKTSHVFSFLEDLVGRFKSSTIIERSSMSIRTCMHLGTIYSYIDSNGFLNVAGKGLKDARNILSFSKDDHIFISKDTWDNLISENPKIGRRYIADEYLNQKGIDGIQNNFYSIYDHSGFGSPEKLPKANNPLVCTEFCNHFRITEINGCPFVELIWRETLEYPSSRDAGPLNVMFKYENKTRCKITDYKIFVNNEEVSSAGLSGLREDKEVYIELHSKDTVCNNKTSLIEFIPEQKLSFFIENECTGDVIFEFETPAGSPYTMHLIYADNDLIVSKRLEPKNLGRSIRKYEIRFTEES